jgi:hypothetical protein
LAGFTKPSRIAKHTAALSVKSVHWVNFHGSIFKVQGLTDTEPRFDVTRAAKFPARDGNGQAKAKHQGKEKE